MMETELIQGIIAVPVIVGVVEVVKRVSGIEDKFVPVVALGLGIASSFGLQFYGEAPWFIALIRGIVIGLSSVGLFSGVKNTLEGLGFLQEE